MNLLALVTEALSSQGIPHALVGGMALAAHGLARAMLDADVLVGRFAWQRAVIARASPVSLPTARIPVVGAADLVLLKIFAGGPQDLVDAQRLLATRDRSKIVSDVAARIDALPETCRQEWERLKSTPLVNC
ncbi:MAG TPA: hypothetical protein VFO62_11245 [Candidatus Binatia bacterium]|nr:hypothetical protein [Candidatus Binatia bacterium]